MWTDPLHKTLKKEGRAFRNFSKFCYIYIPDCKISLASFVLYFHLLLIRSSIRIRSFSFLSWSLLQKLIQDGVFTNWHFGFVIGSRGS